MITMAVQKNSTVVFVYCENNRFLFSKSGCTLHGYTGSTVTVNISGTLMTYNEKGSFISSMRP